MQGGAVPQKEHERHPTSGRHRHAFRPLLIWNWAQPLSPSDSGAKPNVLSPVNFCQSSAIASRTHCSG